MSFYSDVCSKEVAVSDTGQTNATATKTLDEASTEPGISSWSWAQLCICGPVFGLRFGAFPFVISGFPTAPNR